MGSPAGLTTRGWKKTELKAGDQISIEGFGAKDGRNVATPQWSCCRTVENYSAGSKPHPAQHRNKCTPVCIAELFCVSKRTKG
jgi:hypothetical protein